MKKLSVLIVLSCLGVLSARAYNKIANDLIIFSGEGLKFTLFINKVQMNQDHEDRISISDIRDDVVSVRVLFEDKSIPMIERPNLFINFPGNKHENKPVSTVFQVIKKKKGYRIKKVSRSFKDIIHEKKVEIKVYD